MDKPVNLSVKNFLIRKLSTDKVIPEKVIDAVVTHQFSTVVDALLKYKSVEISGWGKFVFNQRRADKMKEVMTKNKLELEQLIQTDLTRIRMERMKVKLESVTKMLSQLNHEA